jgi:hypothetical protein
VGRRPDQELPGGLVGDHPADVVEAPYLAWIATRLLGGLVDAAAGGRVLVRGQVRERWDPAVGQTARQREHARLVGADPQLNRVDGPRAGLETLDAVEASAHPYRVVAPPKRPDDLDRLREGVHGLAGTAPGAAHRDDPLPERPGAEAELEAAFGKDVQARRLLGDHRGTAQGQVRNVREDVHPLRLGKERGDQHPRVEKATLVRVVLDPDEVEALVVGQARDPARFADRCRARIDVRTERDRHRRGQR